MPLKALGTGRALFNAAAALTYILRDQFSTNASAPLTTPRTCEPGPGTLTLVDTNNIISIASERLTINGTPAANDRVVSSAQTRNAGRAFLLSVPTRTTVTSAIILGLAQTATGAPDYAIDYSTTSAIRLKQGTGAIDASFSLGTGIHDFAFIMRGTGAFLLTRNGGSGDYRLAWVYNLQTASEIARIFFSSAAAMNFTADDFRIIDLGSVWTNDYGIAIDRKATTSANDTITTAADGTVEHTLTAATGVTQDIQVRRTDDNNCIIVRCDQGAGTIKLYEKNGGTETEKTGGTTTQTWTNGTAYRVIINLNGSTVKTYVQQGSNAPVSKNNNASVTFNQAVAGAKVDRAGTEFVSWPLMVTLNA